MSGPAACSGPRASRCALWCRLPVVRKSAEGTSSAPRSREKPGPPTFLPSGELTVTRAVTWNPKDLPGPVDKPCTVPPPPQPPQHGQPLPPPQP